MALREKLMHKMMENQFSNLSTEEKQKMMDSMMEKFFAGMTEEEKKEMMAGFQETARSAKFATPELRGLFNEWCEQIESEVLKFVQKAGEIRVEALSEEFKLSGESIKYLLNRLISRGLINYQLRQEETAGKPI